MTPKILAKIGKGCGELIAEGRIFDRFYIQKESMCALKIGDKVLVSKRLNVPRHIDHCFEIYEIILVSSDVKGNEHSPKTWLGAGRDIIVEQKKRI